MPKLDQVVCDQAQVPGAFTIRAAVRAGQSGDVRFYMRGDLGRLAAAGLLTQDLSHIPEAAMEAYDCLADGRLADPELSSDLLLLQLAVIKH